MKQFLTLFVLILIITSGYGQTLITAVEAESGVLTGTNTGNNNAGFSGTGYVTSLDNDGDKFSLSVNISVTASYKMLIRYNGSSGYKIQDIYINGNFVSNTEFPSYSGWTDLDYGSVFLKAGINTIEIRKNWGWNDFDKFSFYTVPTPVFNIDAAPIDPDANDHVIALYSYLRNNFGSKIISGQTDDKFDTVHTITSLTPMIRAFDMQNYSPMNPWGWGQNGPQWGAFDDGSVDRAIAWYAAHPNAIISFQWHWLSPSGGQLRTSTFYTNQTTFDISKAVVPGNQEYTDAIRDIDAIAVQLKKLRDAGVPILWRPLHEAGGGWFWWGAKGAAPAKQLWDIMYDRLTNYHQLHNLIWVWSTPESSWYPGNNKVDILGYDSYPGDYNYIPQKNIFDNLYNIVQGEKMLALSENGPIPDIADCFSAEAPWSYFMSWGDLVYKQNDDAHLIDVMNNPNVITLETLVTSSIHASNKTENCFGPNPADDFIEIYSDDFQEAVIYDMNGREVKRTKAQLVSVSELKPGVYCMVITGSKSVVTKSLIVK